MSSPVQPPLRVETVDGTTSGRPITTIKVTNGDLSISGSVATIDTSGGGGGGGTVTSVGTSQAFITITDPTTTPSISIGDASGAATGVLTATDFNTFDAKQDAITLTTTGTSGAATFSAGILNIPEYSNTTGTVTSITASTPLTGGIITSTGTIGIPKANTTTDGYLSSTDWTTFNNKGSGTVTSVGTSQAFITITDATTTPSISIGNASASATGVLTATDWTTFNNKQDSITLTTTGTSGAATLTGSILNIPQYSGGGGGGTIGGSIASTQVARGASTANEIEGDNGLLFDGTSFTINTLSTSDPVLNMSSNTKSVSLEVNTSQKLTVKGASNSFVFDASSATGGITFPDSTVQLTAATGGGIGGSITDNQVAVGATTADDIEGNTKFTYDSSTQSLNIAAGTGTGTILSGSSDMVIRNSSATAHSKITLGYDAANSNIKLDTDGTGLVEIHKEGSLAYSLPNVVTGANDYVLTAQTDGSTAWAASGGGGGGGAPTNAEYVTLATDATLTNERVLAYGQGIGIIDNGAGNNVNVQSRLFNAPRDKQANKRWVVTKMPPYSLGTSQTTPNTSTLYDRPSFYIFTAPATGDIDELGIFLQTAASTTCNGLLGVYTTTDDGWPNELMGYATFDLTTSGMKLSSSFTYRNGFTAIRTNAGESYWLAFVRDASVGFTISVPHTTYSPQMTWASTSSSPVIASLGFQYTISNNVLPDTPDEVSWTTASTEIYAHASVSYAN